jgi:hypothetical protein
MPVDAIVRVSFQSNNAAHKAAYQALVGSGPFTKTNTAVYACDQKPDADVASALAGLGQALITYATDVDFVSITLVRR